MVTRIRYVNTDESMNPFYFQFRWNPSETQNCG